MATSRSGAGGKIVTSPREQRLGATPYDRPSPHPSLPPPPKSPSWFTGIIVPSARALASGAGKILSSIFSESESSYSGDEDSTLEDDVDNDYHYENPYDGVNKLTKKEVISSERMQCRQEPQLSMQRAETKKIIEHLILQETFTREEGDRLIQVLNSRVVGWSMKVGEKNLFRGSPGKTTDHEDVDIYNKAVQEVKKWFQEKKLGSSLVTEFTHGTRKLHSTGLEQIETGGASFMDVAQLYMKDRPPRASPTGNIELRTPLTMTMKFSKNGTMYSVGHDFLSSSKDPEAAFQLDCSCAASKFLHSLSPNHVQEQHAAFCWLSDIRRWDEESAKECNDLERGAKLKQERELKRLESSVNYDGRKERG